MSNDSEDKMRDYKREMRSVLGCDIYDALVGRGHSAEEIAEMSAERRFDEHCGWHLGDSRWGEDLRRTLGRCSADK